MQPVLYFDHRAVLLALAVTLDFDYFSRHAGPSCVAWMRSGIRDEPGVIVVG